MTMKQRGIPIRFYLGRLTDAETHTLLCVGARMFDKSPALGEWLMMLMTRERKRRRLLSEGEYREVEIPRLPIVSWTNREVATAVQAAHVASYVVRPPAVGEFIDKIAGVVNAAASNRLKETNASH